MVEHSGSNNIYTRRVADFGSHLRYEQIPTDVRERIKLLILDALGCAVYGANLEWDSACITRMHHGSIPPDGC